jgi:hypothetical protein
VTLREGDMNDLIRAKALLENLSVAVKMAHLLGAPIEKGFDLLPENWRSKIGELTQAALAKAMHTAIGTMRDAPGVGASNRWHKIAVAATGGLGGFFGLGALAAELPVSTAIMLRSIADVARSEGESIRSVAAQMACLEVFALGGAGRRDDAAESGYYAIRAALAQTLTRAAEYVAEKGLAEESAPALVRLIVVIAQRFSIQVSEKAAAQAVPAIGAAGGALINTVFIDHFQDMARGHFIIRRLERIYGKAAVEAAYKAMQHL